MGPRTGVSNLKDGLYQAEYHRQSGRRLGAAGSESQTQPPLVAAKGPSAAAPLPDNATSRPCPAGSTPEVVSNPRRPSVAASSFDPGTLCGVIAAPEDKLMAIAWMMLARFTASARTVSKKTAGGEGPSPRATRLPETF